MQGYLLGSGLRKLSWPTSVRSKRRQGVSSRSGQLMQYKIGSFMSGHPSWASTEESANSTIEWMIDWGWITISMWS